MSRLSSISRKPKPKQQQHRRRSSSSDFLATATATATQAGPIRGLPINRSINAGAAVVVVAIGLLVGCGLLLAPAGSMAYPSGAPDQACKDLKPGHGAEASTSQAPFELTQDKLQVEAGDQIKVTLSGSPAKTTNFKGLIVQALNEKGEPRGKFLPGKGLKTLDSCSAVTHSDREAKKTATLVWEAPAELKAKEAFTFRATVVVKFDEFYMNIKSTMATR